MQTNSITALTLGQLFLSRFSLIGSAQATACGDIPNAVMGQLDSAVVRGVGQKTTWELIRFETWLRYVEITEGDQRRAEFHFGTSDEKITDLLYYPSFLHIRIVEGGIGAPKGSHFQFDAQPWNGMGPDKLIDLAEPTIAEALGTIFAAWAHFAKSAEIRKLRRK